LPDEDAFWAKGEFARPFYKLAVKGSTKAQLGDKKFLFLKEDRLRGSQKHRVKKFGAGGGGNRDWVRWLVLS